VRTLSYTTSILAWYGNAWSLPASCHHFGRWNCEGIRSHRLFVSVNRGKGGMISTQFEAWKKVGPWQESRCSADVSPLERDSNRLATSGSITGISLKGNNDEAQKLWGGALLTFFLDWSWWRWKKLAKMAEIVRCSVHFLHWFFVRSGADLVLLLSDILEVTWAPRILFGWRWKEVLNAIFFYWCYYTGIFGIPINIYQPGWGMADLVNRCTSHLFSLHHVGSKRKVPDSSAQNSPAVSCRLAKMPDCIWLSRLCWRTHARSIQIHELKIVWLVLIFPFMPAVVRHVVVSCLTSARAYTLSPKLTHCPFEKVQRTAVMWNNFWMVWPHMGLAVGPVRPSRGFPLTLNLCLDGIWIGVWSQIELGFNMFQSIPE